MAFAASACLTGAYLAIVVAETLVSWNVQKPRRLAQVVIQLRKFAEAVRRIKAAVSPDASPGRAQVRGSTPLDMWYWRMQGTPDLLNTLLGFLHPGTLASLNIPANRGRACGAPVAQEPKPAGSNPEALQCARRSRA